MTVRFLASPWAAWGWHLCSPASITPLLWLPASTLPLNLYYSWLSAQHLPPHPRHGMSGSLQLGDARIHSSPFLWILCGPCTKNLGSPALHKPSNLGTSRAGICLPLLGHCTVQGIFVVPQHPLCLCSGHSPQVFFASPWVHPTSFSL